MKRYIFILSIFLLFFSVDSSYSQNSSEIPKAWHKKGETLTSFFGVSLYNGTLFAPVDKPEVAVATLVEGVIPQDHVQGGLTATPIARDLIQAYFDQKNAKLAHGDN